MSHGLGLRAQHFTELLEHGLRADFAEVISENFLGRGGRPLAVLERVRRDMPVALHGVSLSIGGLDPLSRDYLRGLRALADRVDAAWVSDHFCFGTFGGHAGHDLWPLPFTAEAITHVVERVHRVQDALGRRLVLENVSSYVQYQASELSEWDFIGEVLRRADCELLLDLNNLHVNAMNHGYDAARALRGVDGRRLRQLHLAGHSDLGTHLFDDHGAPVSEPVWRLFVECVRTHGPRPTIVEWDERVPPLATVLAECDRARSLEAAAAMGAAS